MKHMLGLLIIWTVAFSNAALGADEATKQPPEGMVYVPPGAFIMGSEIGDADESPQHLASTEDFFIDQYEVSNASYKKVNPSHTYAADKDNSPVLVTWEQATAYAKAIGKRLPTEKEWEKAARGTDGRMFPWGDSYDESFIQFDSRHGIGETIAKPQSPYGCYDMASGVMEWTSDWYAPYPGNPVPSDKYGEKFKVLKGGTSFNDVAHMRCAHRFYLPANDRNRYATGFRCVKDVDKK